jgi:hypothetical protein
VQVNDFVCVTWLKAYGHLSPPDPDGAVMIAEFESLRKLLSKKGRKVRRFHFL